MSGFRIDMRDLERGIEALSPKGPVMSAALLMFCETAAKDFEAYAKEHRPWTDRTSQARQRLRGYVEKTEKGYRIIVAHGVDYGIMLELAREKKYAILEPTIRLKSSEVLKSFKSLLSKLGKRL